MWDRIRELFCCSQAENVITPINSNRRRVTTSFSQEQVVVVADEVRRAGATECFSCPICFLYFSKILACTECHNFICCNCLAQLVEKADRQASQMKCCFCSSMSCRFEDWKQAEQKQYFDMTNKEAFKNLPLQIEHSQVQIEQPPSTLERPNISVALGGWAHRPDPAHPQTI